MSDRLNSVPPAEFIEPVIAGKMEVAKAKAQAAKDQAVQLVRKYPKVSIGVAAAAMAVGYYAYAHAGPTGTPVAQAALQAPPSKTVSSGRQTEVEMVVGSFRKTEGLLILNNHTDYRQATMNVVVDLKLCPELATIDGRALKGQTIRAKGESQTYQGKPQVMVRRAADLRIDEVQVKK